MYTINSVAASSVAELIRYFTIHKTKLELINYKDNKLAPWSFS